MSFKIAPNHTHKLYGVSVQDSPSGSQAVHERACGGRTWQVAGMPGPGEAAGLPTLDDYPGRSAIYEEA